MLQTAATQLVGERAPQLRHEHRVQWKERQCRESETAVLRASHLHCIIHPPTMFSSSVQPGLVSLFSSTGSDPLELFFVHQDTSLPSDSFVCILNDSSSHPAPPPPRTLITAIGPDDNEAAPAPPNYTLDQNVLHMQSPTLRSTYIRCPPSGRDGPAGSSRASTSGGHLGLKHPWVHLQVRNMEREWAFEVGIIDHSGREGVIRCATFQVRDSSSFVDTPLPRLKSRTMSKPILSVLYVRTRMNGTLFGPAVPYVLIRGAVTASQRA